MKESDKTRRDVMLRCLSAIALACCLSVDCVAAPDAVSMERNVKAAFLYKFLSYVEYPQAAPPADAPYVVGVIGADDVAAELTRITAGRNVNNHPVQVRALHGSDVVAGLNMLFVGVSESVDLAPLLHAAQQAGVLSVTEVPGALQAGSVINFRLVDDHVRFEVSLESAEKSNLKLSSRLLTVAYAVVKGGGS